MGNSAERRYASTCRRRWRRYEEYRCRSPHQPEGAEGRSRFRNPTRKQTLTHPRRRKACLDFALCFFYQQTSLCQIRLYLLAMAQIIGDDGIDVIEIERRILKEE